MCVFQRIKEKYKHTIVYYTEATCGLKEKTHVASFLPSPFITTYLFMPPPYISFMFLVISLPLSNLSISGQK